MIKKNWELKINRNKWVLHAGILFVILLTLSSLNIQCKKSDSTNLTTNPTDTSKKNNTNTTTPSISPNDYQVWLNTALMPANAITDSKSWSNTASQISGLIINTSSLTPTPGTISQNETPLTNWPSFYSLLKIAQNQCLVPFARSEFVNPYSNLGAGHTIAAYLKNNFAKAQTNGYQITTVMFYDNCPGANCAANPQYNWEVDSVQTIRNWLNANGHTDVKIANDLRGYLYQTSVWMQNPLVQQIVIEGDPEAYNFPRSVRDTILQYIQEKGIINTKPVLLSLPMSSLTNPLGNPSAYQSTRALLMYMGSTLGYNFLRTSNLVFILTQYNYSIPFYPETLKPTTYNNSMTGIALSLIEQRKTFEGFNGAVDTSFANNYNRTATP